MGKSKSRQGADHDLDINQNHFPEFKKVLTRILQDDAIGSRQVERIEVNCLRNGEATYRFWEPLAEEPDGGFLPRA